MFTNKNHVNMYFEVQKKVSKCQGGPARFFSQGTVKETRCVRERCICCPLLTPPKSMLTLPFKISRRMSRHRCKQNTCRSKQIFEACGDSVQVYGTLSMKMKKHLPDEVLDTQALERDLPNQGDMFAISRVDDDRLGLARLEGDAVSDDDP